MPGVIKPSRISAALQPQAVEGGSLLTVSAFLLFDVSDPYTLFTEQALWPMVAEQMPDGAIFDKGQLKPRAEMIIAGHALAPGDLPVTALKVTARFGDRVKRLAVFGDRFWRNTDRGLELAGPAPFDKMPVSEARAFGGEGFGANRAGKGFGADKLLEAGFDAPLPNVEDADNLILSPADMPQPAHFGPIGPDNPERMKLAGTYDKHWVNHVSPLRPADFNPLFHCDGPEDQRFETYLQGGETFSVTGMSRTGMPVSGTVPGFRVRAFVHRTGDDSLTETDMVCDTATLFPNVGKMTLAFRGLARSADRFADDIGTVLLAVEHADAAPRPHAHYDQVFRLRTDPEEAYKHALADHQLMPETDPAIRLARREERLERARLDREKFLADADWNIRKTLDREGLPAEVLPPPDPDRGSDVPLIALPSAEEFASGDFDIAELIEDAEALEAELNALADAEFAKAELLQRKVDKAAPEEVRSLVPSRPLASDAQLADLSLAPESDTPVAPDTLTDVPASLKQAATDNLAIDDIAARSAEAQANVSDMLHRLSDLTPNAEDQAAEQYRLACARALGAPEGALFHPLRQQLEELTIDTRLLPAALEDPLSLVSGERVAGLPASASATSAPSSPSQETDVLAALAKAGDMSATGVSGARQALPEALGPAEAALAAECGHLIEDGMEDQPLAGMMATLTKMELPEAEDADLPLSDRLEQVNEDLKASLDRIEPQFMEALATGRQLSPEALFPQEPMPAGVATAAGALVARHLAQGHDFKGADMAGLSLRGLDFSDRDLSGTFFEQADLTGAVFRNCLLDGAVFTSARLEHAVFEGCSLTGANLSGANLREADLSAARLAGMTLICTDLTGVRASHAELQDVTLVECTLDDADLDGSRLENVKLTRGSAERLGLRQASLGSVLFVDLPLHKASFAASKMQQVVFTEVAAKAADFTAATLSETGFHGGCDLASARFENILAVDTCWNGALLEESLYLRADCRSCLFNQCDMQWVDGRAASFKKAKFLQSDLKYSDFGAADFFAASLSQTDLRRASMRHANLYAADLVDARLASCDLSHANLGATAIQHAVCVAPH